MTQARKSQPRTPKQAARTPRALDALLDPEVFRALADPTRLRLLAALAKCARPCGVSEAAECCTVDLSVVSRHLAALARAGLLESRKQGRQVAYRVRFDAVVGLLRALAGAIEDCCPGGACRARTPSRRKRRSSP